MFGYTGSGDQDYDDHVANCISWVSTNDPGDNYNSADVTEEQYQYWSQTNYEFNSTYKVRVDLVVQIIGINDVDIHDEVLDTTLSIQMVFILLYYYTV